jgi:hypothetical protein
LPHYIFHHYYVAVIRSIYYIALLHSGFHYFLLFRLTIGSTSNDIITSNYSSTQLGDALTTPCTGITIQTPSPHPTLPSPYFLASSCCYCQTSGFLRERLPSGAAAGVHISLTLSRASYHLLICLIVHRLSKTPAAYHHGRRRRHRSHHGGSYGPLRHWQHRHAAGAVLMSRWAPRLAFTLGAAAEENVCSLTARPPHTSLILCALLYISVHIQTILLILRISLNIMHIQELEYL